MASKKTLEKKRRELAEESKRKAESQSAANKRRPVTRSECGDFRIEIEKKMERIETAVGEAKGALTYLKEALVQAGLITDEQIVMAAQIARNKAIRNQLENMKQQGFKNEALIRVCMEYRVDPKSFPDLIDLEESDGEPENS